MNATILVTLEVDDPSEVSDYAADIFDALESNGMPIVSATPWSREQTTTTPTNPYLNETPKNLLG